MDQLNGEVSDDLFNFFPFVFGWKALPYKTPKRRQIFGREKGKQRKKKEMGDSSQSNSLVFSIRIVSIDYYMSSPIPGLDISYSSFQGYFILSFFFS